MNRETEAECLRALRGESLPANLDSVKFRLCVLRGIRHFDGFGAELRRLHSPPTTSYSSSLIRALNARDVMSNRIPDIETPDEFPYCIWYPDVASEETYRRLAARYPSMRYLVGRACAVAGYADLFRELRLLPEVSIAEEARDGIARNNPGCRAIYEEIISQPLRYAILDDYTRTSTPDKPRRVAGLNGDTTVVSTLENGRLSFKEAGSISYRYFNITEDWCVDEGGLEEEPGPVPCGDDMTRLLYTPLPEDLPAGNKNLLILMAAYYGDVDRYHRLRRPDMLRGELEAVVRGIYHNTMFAMYTASQLDAPPNKIFVPSSSSPLKMPTSKTTTIHRAVNARFIMNNDLSRITDAQPAGALPYMIWYPHRAHPATYEELARRRPEMIPAVARACIVADYEKLWDSLAWTPDAALFREAKASPKPQYLQTLTSRAENMLGPQQTPSPRGVPLWKLAINANNMKDRRPPTALWPSMSEGNFEWGQTGPYEGLQADAGDVELFVSASELIRPPPGRSWIDVTSIYKGENNSSETRDEVKRES
ncbi:hypothetical protein F5Y14DRAFT_110049 [Nemania sp. NC0429]|nr:hypothetical protein F5Y14DRAFT_110049 [Nemania sp. NC0429]